MKKNIGLNYTVGEKLSDFRITGRPVHTRLLLLLLVVIFPLMTGSARAAVPLPNYGTTTLAAGTNNAAAKIGDLDGDGLNDIAVVSLTGDLQLFFNRGAGSFERVSLNGLRGAGASTPDLDIGDLNDDGRNDLAVAFTTPNGTVSVLLNLGNRVFSAPVHYNLCGASTGVAIGDLDGDGDRDLADIGECNRAGILLNSGQGSFVFNGAYGGGVASKSIALADFNGDNFKDIVYLSAGAAGSRSVALLFNNQNGTFGNPVTNYAGDLPSDLTVGDFNNDGGTDIAVANAYHSQIIMLFLAPNGTFVGYSELEGGDTPDSIVSSDLNGDGQTDLAATSRNNNNLSVFLNRGNFNFDGPRPFNVGLAPVDVAAGKLDGDDLPDLVAVNQGGGSISVLFSTGITPPPSPSPAPRITLSVSTALTGTARVVDLRWNGATASSVEIYRNGARLITVSNSGRYTNLFERRARGTYRYKVCQPGAQACSNEETAVF